MRSSSISYVMHASKELRSIRKPLGLRQTSLSGSMLKSPRKLTKRCLLGTQRNYFKYQRGCREREKKRVQVALANRRKDVPKGKDTNKQMLTFRGKKWALRDIRMDKKTTEFQRILLVYNFCSFVLEILRIEFLYSLFLLANVKLIYVL